MKEYIKPNGDKYETKIGEDGRAVMERHYTDHGDSQAHTNPHDHIINWDSPKYGSPNFEKPHINYPDGNVPELNQYEVKNMSNPIILPQDYNFNFESISDFKDCISRGGEVEFIWKGKSYSITHNLSREIGILEVYKQETKKLYNSADEALEYIIDGVRLRELITKVKLTDRTI